MFANQKSERACRAMLCGGAGACAVTLVMLPAAMLGGRAEGAELLLRLLAYALIAGACGIFAWVGYLGVRPVTAKRYRLGCFVLAAGLLLRFLSAALLYLQVTGGLASVYLLGSMLVCLLGIVFMLYVGADAGTTFFQRRNDGKILLFLLAVSTVLSLFPLLLLGSAGSPFVWPEAVGLFVTGVLRFALPACYVWLVDRIRDPFSEEEVAEELKRRREQRQAEKEAARKERERKQAERKAAREAARKERERKQAERRQAREAEKKAKEEAARQKAEEEKRRAEAARLAAEEAARKAEEARRAEEERQKAEAARLAAEAAKKEQEKAEEDAKTKARRLAAAEAKRLAPEVFGCTPEEWERGKRA